MTLTMGQSGRNHALRHAVLDATGAGYATAVCGNTAYVHVVDREPIPWPGPAPATAQYCEPCQERAKGAA